MTPLGSAFMLFSGLRHPGVVIRPAFFCSGLPLGFSSGSAAFSGLVLSLLGARSAATGIGVDWGYPRPVTGSLRPLVLAAAVLLSACIEADPESNEPPGLADAPEARGELVYEETLRWPHQASGSSSWQTASVYRDGDRLLLLRRGLDGRVHGWAEGPLLSGARDGLDADTAAADPSLGAALDPWSDSHAAALLLDGERHEFPTMCAGPGLDALARRYAGLSNELLACPFPGWVAEFDHDPTFVPSFSALACEADEPWESPA